MDAYVQGLGTDRAFPGFILRRSWNTRVGSGMEPVDRSWNTRVGGMEPVDRSWNSRVGWGTGAGEGSWNPQLGGETGLVAKRNGVEEEETSRPGENSFQ